MKRLPIDKDKLYKSYYEKSIDLYRTIDNDGIIIACNDAYAKQLGYSKNEVLGESIYTHVAKESEELLKDSFETWKKTGRVKNRELMLKRKNGETFPILLSASNLYDERGNLVGSNTIMRDISDLHDARHEINKLHSKRLETIGILTSRIAHDLRNPLSVLNSTVQLMRQNGFSNDKKYLQYLQLLNDSSRRITHQVEEVLAYIRPSSLSLKPNSVLGIIKNAANNLVIFENIKLTIPKNDAKILCDSEKLEIVLINLILNSMQAMEYNGTIDVNLTDSDNEIKISVKDSGPGIPDDLLPKIFDPMFTTRQIGTGLGLVSCKSIVEQHNGRIDVKSKINHGTTFTVTLPKTNTDNAN